MRKWLINIRKEKGYTQEFVAECTGISRAFYTEIERGSKNPSVDTAKGIAEVLCFEWTNFFV